MRNWYVITGGPSAGKTMLIEALGERGFHVEHESARLVIDEGLAQGKTLEDIRADEESFQEVVYRHKDEREKRLDSNELIFFDRGMQDTHAYYTLHGFDMAPETERTINKAQYKKVFLLEPFAYEKDYARTESAEEVAKLFELLQEAYECSGCEVALIPSFPTKEERIRYFLDYLAQEEGITIPQMG